jgi:hypothetical protein
METLKQNWEKIATATSWRLLITAPAIYTSDAGSGLPLKAQCRIPVTDLVGI